LIFPPKWYHVGSASISHFLVLDPHLKAMGPIYGSHPIGLFYFIGTWTLDPCLKFNPSCCVDPNRSNPFQRKKKTRISNCPFSVK
jgi:hypothetical protein